VVDMSVRLSAAETWDVIFQSHARRATLVAEVVRDAG